LVDANKQKKSELEDGKSYRTVYEGSMIRAYPNSKDIPFSGQCASIKEDTDEAKGGKVGVR
jgi:hypothetical protein